VDEGDGYSVIDTQTGVASQGETRREALRMLAEAIEALVGFSCLLPTATISVLRAHIGQETAS
jgi:predicted RNase H-like HicB family nuclease